MLERLRVSVNSVYQMILHFFTYTMVIKLDLQFVPELWYLKTWHICLHRRVMTFGKTSSYTHRSLVQSCWLSI